MSNTNYQANNNTNTQANMNATSNQANNDTNTQANMNATNNQANQNTGEVCGGHEDDDDSIQDEESNQSSEDDDMTNLTSNDVATVRAAMVAAITNSMSFLAASMLDEVPTTIEGNFSSVVGDSFHFMDRPKVPMQHVGKKGYFVALRQAWFQWDLTKLAEVKATLHDERGMNDSAIEAMLYYDVDFFRVRVPHIVLPPSKLYWGVCVLCMNCMDQCLMPKLRRRCSTKQHGKRQIMCLERSLLAMHLTHVEWFSTRNS
jgi:hypothetical protein